MAKQRNIIEQTFLSSVISIILAAMAVLIGVVIDGIIIGRFLGPDNLAAYTLISPIVNIVTVFSSILSTGVQVICAQRIGEGNIKGARQAFSICMVVTSIISAALMLAAILSRDEIAILLGATGESSSLLPLASDYLLGLALAGPASIFLFEFNSLMRLDGDASRIVFAVAVMTVMDIAGDLLNVFLFRGGMLGMGLTTSISYLAALFIMCLHFGRKDIIFRFSPKGMKMRDLADILIIGAPSAVGSASTALRTIVDNHIMVKTARSVNAVGAFGILNTVFTFTSCVLIGVGITTSMIAGMILGEKDRKSAEQLIRISVRTATAIGIGLCILVFAFSDPVAHLFGNKDGEVMVKMASRGLKIFSVSLIFYGINSTFTNYLQGIRRMGHSIVLSFLHTFFFLAMPAFLLSERLEENAVWLSFGIGEILTLSTFFLLAAVKRKGIPLRAKDFLYLKEPFGEPEDEILNVTVNAQEDILPACEQIKMFCASKNADERQTDLLTSYARKHLTNTVRYGFDENGSNTLEIRLVRHKDRWTMRLRDNCKPFDLTGSEDIKEEGVRTEYVNTLSLNVLTVELTA